MVAVERGQRRGQARRVHGGGGHPHAPAGDAGVPVKVGPGARDLREDRLRARQELLARRRELRPARRAPQQRDPELRLEPPDLLGERGLRDPQLLGRARELPVARDGDEVLEPPQLHQRATLSARSSRRP
jgi:hypothetical protein